MSVMLSLWKGSVRTPGDSVRECLERAAERYGVTVEEIKSGNALRARQITNARREACYRLRDLTWPDGRPRLSYPRIAQIVGLKCHTSVMSTIRAYVAQSDRRDAA